MVPTELACTDPHLFLPLPQVAAGLFDVDNDQGRARHSGQTGGLEVMSGG